MTRRALQFACAGTIALPLASTGTDPISVLRLGVCGAALAAIASIDLAEHRIPNRIVLPATAACAALSAVGGISATTLLAALAIVGVLLLIAFAWPAALGMGDVKLALLIVLGLDDDASRALTAGLVLAALSGVVVIARHGRAAGRRALPLAPFLAVGSLLALLQ
jgi:leader peptidase (prepilin peptidase) / N-methyltransferase